MVVGRPRIATVDIGVPAVIHEGVAGFVSSAGPWTLMHRNGGRIDVLLFDVIEVAHGRVLGGICGWRGGCDGDRHLAPFPPWLAGLVGCGHGGVEGGELAHHPLVLLLLICMDCLCMLAQIVETRELLGAVASEGTLASVFPNVPGEVFASAEDHATFAKASTLECLCWCRAVAFSDAGGGGRGGGEDGGDVWGDECHVRGGGGG
jgi:hypothetical protein